MNPSTATLTANRARTLPPRGWTGLLWAVRSKVIPIRDRAHQLNAYNYILEHAEEGAWVWDFLKGENYS